MDVELLSQKEWLFDIYALLCIKQASHGNLLYSAGNSPQAFVVTQMGGNPEKRGYVYVDTDFTLLYSRNLHNIVKQLYSNKNIKIKLN